MANGQTLQTNTLNQTGSSQRSGFGKFGVYFLAGFILGAAISFAVSRVYFPGQAGQGGANSAEVAKSNSETGNDLLNNAALENFTATAGGLVVEITPDSITVERAGSRLIAGINSQTKVINLVHNPDGTLGQPDAGSIADVTAGDNVSLVISIIDGKPIVSTISAEGSGNQ
jgi:hypothetical protein